VCCKTNHSVIATAHVVLFAGFDRVPTDFISITSSSDDTYKELTSNERLLSNDSVPGGQARFVQADDAINASVTLQYPYSAVVSPLIMVVSSVLPSSQSSAILRIPTVPESYTVTRSAGKYNELGEIIFGPAQVLVQNQDFVGFENTDGDLQTRFIVEESPGPDTALVLVGTTIELKAYSAAVLSISSSLTLNSSNYPGTIASRSNASTAPVLLGDESVTALQLYDLTPDLRCLGQCCRFASGINATAKPLPQALLDNMKEWGHANPGQFVGCPLSLLRAGTVSFECLRVTMDTVNKATTTANLILSDNFTFVPHATLEERWLNVTVTQRSIRIFQQSTVNLLNPDAVVDIQAPVLQSDQASLTYQKDVADTRSAIRFNFSSSGSAINGGSPALFSIISGNEELTLNGPVDIPPNVTTIDAERLQLQFPSETAAARAIHIVSATAAIQAATIPLLRNLDVRTQNLSISDASLTIPDGRTVMVWENTSTSVAQWTIAVGSLSHTNVTLIQAIASYTTVDPDQVSSGLTPPGKVELLCKVGCESNFFLSGDDNVLVLAEGTSGASSLRGSVNVSAVWNTSNVVEIRLAASENGLLRVDSQAASLSSSSSIEARFTANLVNVTSVRYVISSHNVSVELRNPSAISTTVHFVNGAMNGVVRVYQLASERSISVTDATTVHLLAEDPTLPTFSGIQGLITVDGSTVVKADTPATVNKRLRHVLTGACVSESVLDDPPPLRFEEVSDQKSALQRILDSTCHVQLSASVQLSLYSSFQSDEVWITDATYHFDVHSRAGADHLYVRSVAGYNASAATEPNARRSVFLDEGGDFIDVAAELPFIPLLIDFGDDEDADLFRFTHTSALPVALNGMRLLMMLQSKPFELVDVVHLTYRDSVTSDDTSPPQMQLRSNAKAAVTQVPCPEMCVSLTRPT